MVNRFETHAFQIRQGKIGFGQLFSGDRWWPAAQARDAQALIPSVSPFPPVPHVSCSYPARMPARESTNTHCAAMTPLNAEIMAADHGLPRSFVS